MMSNEIEGYYLPRVNSNGCVEIPRAGDGGVVDWRVVRDAHEMAALSDYLEELVSRLKQGVRYSA